jgi:hypothetical protein
MMKRWFLTVAVAAVATMGVAAFASADVQRYQPTATLFVSLIGSGKDHTFTITWTHPCGTDGAFSGVGHGNAASGGADEMISGTLVGDQLKFTAVYTSYVPGYTWSYDGPLSGADLSIGLHATAEVTTITRSRITVTGSRRGVAARKQLTRASACRWSRTLRSSAIRSQPEKGPVDTGVVVTRTARHRGPFLCRPVGRDDLKRPPLRFGMAESTLLALLLRYPNAVAIARRVSAATLHEGIRRLERAGFVVGGQGVYRVTRRGRAALELDAALRATVRRALHS